MDSGFRRKDGRGGVYANSRANGRRAGDVDSGFRRKDGGGPPGRRRGFRLSPERRRGGPSGRVTWIPAFAGKTGGVAAYMPTCGQTDAGEGTWIPAFAGRRSWRHRGGDVDSGFRRKDGGGPSGRGRGFRLSPERRGWAIREGTWIRAFAGKTEGVAALRFSPARCFVVLYRSRELRPQRFVHMGHTEHCLFVEGPSRNLKPDGQAFGV